MCRHWRRFGPRSSIGRCENQKSGYVFTKEEISCDWFEMLRFVHAGDRIFASS
jgi:hypothetical protein